MATAERLIFISAILRQIWIGWEEKLSAQLLQQPQNFGTKYCLPNIYFILFNLFGWLLTQVFLEEYLLLKTLGRISNIRLTCIRYKVSDIRYQVSENNNQISSIRYQIWNNMYQISSIIYHRVIEELLLLTRTTTVV